MQFTDQTALMTPHYVLWTCGQCRKGGYVEDNKDCVSGGRYCAPDPDLEGPLTGRMVVQENLRQICIAKQTEKLPSEKLW